MPAKDFMHGAVLNRVPKQDLADAHFTSTVSKMICKTGAFRSKKSRFQSASGFTLLEVMVALAIFATAAMTLTKVAMQYTQSTAHAVLRTKAQFVALNEAAQMEINQEWLSGTSSRQLTQQNETWQIDKRSEPTISPNVQRIELQVSLINTESGQVESGISTLTFFNHRKNPVP